MDIEFVKSANRIIRSTRPVLCEGFCEVFQSGALLEISFLSKQCRNDMAGSCLMCDYGRANNSGTIQNFIDEMNNILNTCGQEYKFLLLGCNGSILDEYQISIELLTRILESAQNCKIPRVILEVHYQDVTVEKLQLIKRIVKKPVIIELGLETINQKYQNLIIMKGIEIERFQKTIEMIHSYDYDVDLNIMFGLPFLPLKEQLEDILLSVNWAIRQDCNPIVFPINIKSHTMLRYVYDYGLYQPVSLWALVLLLDRLNSTALSRVIIAWYGNRDDSYPGDIPTIFPQSCDKCKDILNAFFRKFLDTCQYEERKLLVNELLNEPPLWVLRKGNTSNGATSRKFRYQLFSFL